MLSLIIPTKNRSKILKSLLLELNKQKGIFEVIIVDDASTDGTKELFNNLDINLNYDLTYIRLKNQSGLPSARNIGIKYSNFNTIGFLDDDCIPIRDDLLNRGYRWLNVNSSNIIGVGGAIYFRSNKSHLELNSINFKKKIKFHQIYKFIKNKILLFYEAPFKLKYVNFLHGGNFFFKKEFIKLCNGFDLKFDGNFFHEDTDICMSLRKYGKLILDPKMPVNHLGINFGGCRRDLVNYYFNFISNTILLLLKHKKITVEIFLTSIINIFGFLKRFASSKDTSQYFIPNYDIKRINLLKSVFNGFIMGFIKYFSQKKEMVLEYSISILKST